LAAIPIARRAGECRREPTTSAHVMLFVIAVAGVTIVHGHVSAGASW
jgi:hypothetical protein